MTGDRQLRCRCRGAGVCACTVAGKPAAVPVVLAAGPRKAPSQGSVQGVGSAWPLTAAAAKERHEANVRRHMWAASTVARGEAGIDAVPSELLGPVLTAACAQYGELMADGHLLAASRVLDEVRRDAAAVRRRREQAQLDEVAERVKGRDWVILRRLARWSDARVAAQHSALRERVAAALPGRGVSR